MRRWGDLSKSHGEVGDTLGRHYSRPGRCYLSGHSSRPGRGHARHKQSWEAHTSPGASCYSDAQNSGLVFQIWKIFPDLFQMEAGNVLL